jgi:hypothetical protein
MREDQLDVVGSVYFLSFIAMCGRDMARNKPIVTRTFAPIHFEDLDPHRFEDVIRELIYDFREWQSIEATGRSGDDAGFDIRAFEKVTQLTPVDDDDEEVVEKQHPMDGPRWMIQGKREKALTPSDIKKILIDVDATDPPYGYILAASAVFSKKSYDVFRDELRKKGVMEFYLWGRPELEDMLHLPKNDRILFTFFGISLVSRRRSRTTEIRTTVAVKNKLYKLLGGPNEDIEKSVLIRDVNDVHYPHRGEYPDFDKNPRWIERIACRHHPNGLFFKSREFFAFVNRRKKEWDFTEHTDSLVGQREILTEAENEEHARKRQDVFDIWSFLPRAQQGKFVVEAFLPYSDILLVDPIGDGYHTRPHLFVEFAGRSGPYSGVKTGLFVKGQEVELDDSWHRIDFFPKTFSRSVSEPPAFKVQKVNLDLETLKTFRGYERLDTLYAVDDRFDSLRQRDIIAVADNGELPDAPQRRLLIKHIQKSRLLEYINDHDGNYHVRWAAQRQIGREIGDEELVTILEVEITYASEE